MQEPITVERVKNALLSLGDELQEAEAIGVCGSLARGDFGPQSDIDIFVVVEKKKDAIKDDDLWHHRIHRVLEEFNRDVTVIVYSRKGLEMINNWYVLRLASEGILLFDKGNIGELFEKIIECAKNAGLVEDKIGNRKFWKFANLRTGEHWEIKLK